MTMNIFERASRLGLTHQHKGMLNTDDLWNLSLISLDTLAKNYHAQIKQQEEVSFISETKNTDTIAQLSLDIVKHIIDSKLSDKKASASEAAKQVERTKLLSALESKENDARSNMSKEELLVALDAL